MGDPSLMDDGIWVGLLCGVLMFPSRMARNSLARNGPHALREYVATKYKIRCI
jgi:hypothetical protein